MKPLPEDPGTLVPSHDLPDTGTLVSAILDLGTMVINSDTDTEATMKSKSKTEYNNKLQHYMYIKFYSCIYFRTQHWIS